MGELSSAAQIAVIGLGGLWLFFVTFVLLKKGGKLEYKNCSFAVGQKASVDERVAQVSDYMTDKLASIRQCFFRAYLRLMKDQGCKEELLVENEDSQFYGQMLGNIVYSGNGIHSIKSIFEKTILDGAIINMEYHRLVAFLLCSIEDNAIAYINKNYSSIVRYADGEERERLVSNTELVDSLKKCMEGVQEIIVDIISFAREIYKEEK